MKRCDKHAIVPRSCIQHGLNSCHLFGFSPYSITCMGVAWPHPGEWGNIVKRVSFACGFHSNNEYCEKR